MIKKSFRLMLLAAFALSSVMFVACNKYDEDIERIDNELAALNATVSTLKAAVDGGAVISSVSNTSEGVKFTLSNGQSYTVNHGAVGKDGQDGKPGSVVTIGENGNWFIDGVDQNVSAVGASTFVVDCGAYYELNVMEKVEGENAEIVKINLPKTTQITDIKVVTINGTSISYGGAAVALNYGPKLTEDIKFNNVTYAKKSYLVAAGDAFSAVINPMNADASLYNFYLVDSKGNVPFKVGEAKANKTDGALTKGTPTANNGVYNMSVTFADGFDFSKVPADNVAYALATTTANGTVASDYEVTVAAAPKTSGTITYATSFKDEDTAGEIDLSEVFTAGEEFVVDYYFELANPTTDAARGVVLNGTTLTAPANTKDVELVLYYLPVWADDKADIVKATGIKANFAYVAGAASLSDVSWTIQNDGKSSTNEHIVYVPLGNLQNSLIGAVDTDMPTITSLENWKWADGTAFDKKTVTRNGKKYGKNDGSSAYAGAIPADGFPTINGFYYVDNNGKYQPAVQGTTTIDKALYVAFVFDPVKAFPGEFKVTLGINKYGNNTTNYNFEVPVNVTIVAPATPEIVKNAPYFNGDNAVVYGTATNAGVTEDFDNLFTTTGLTFSFAKVAYDLNQDGSIKDDEKVYAWTINSDNVVTIPLRTDDTQWASTGTVKTSYYDAFNVGSTQTVTATKLVLGNKYIDQSSYTFTVTAKSPVNVSYTGAAKAIDNNPIYIDASEFTGKSMKDGSALYIGKVGTKVVDPAYITEVKVAADANDANKKYITVVADNFNNGATVDYKDAEGNVLYSAQAVKVERVSGIALQSPVTCKVNVTVKDMWGVTTVVPVNVTVNPIQ